MGVPGPKGFNVGWSFTQICALINQLTFCPASNLKHDFLLKGDPGKTGELGSPGVSGQRVSVPMKMTSFFISFTIAANLIIS